MKIRAWWAFGLAFILGLPTLLSPPDTSRDTRLLPSGGELRAQETVPGQKPGYDYMSSYLSRNTKPLGLEEDREVRELRNEPVIKWAIRAGWRHSLQ